MVYVKTAQVFLSYKFNMSPKHYLAARREIQSQAVLIKV